MAHFLTITAEWVVTPGNKAVNTYHYSADGAGIFGVSAADKTNQANAAIGQLRTFYNSLCTAGLNGTWVIGSTVIERQTGQPPAFVAATPLSSTPTSGTITAYQLAACIAWKTGLAGRSYRGRSYIGPLRASACTMPDLSSTFATACQTAAGVLIAAPSGTDLVPAVYSDVLDETHRITSALCTTALRTMRSRAS